MSTRKVDSYFRHSDEIQVGFELKLKTNLDAGFPGMANTSSEWEGFQPSPREITDGQPSHMPNSPLPLLLLSAPKLFHEAAFLHFVEIARVDHFLRLDRLGARLGGRDFIERRLDAFEFDR